MKELEVIRGGMTARPFPLPRAGLWSFLLAVAVSASVQAASIVDSKHNLAASGHGPGGVRATDETHVCIFCHTPHIANPAAPHWNRPSSGAIYTPYNSSTAKATFGQPTGSSKLCLSCHDGTIALGMIVSKSPIQFAGGIHTMPRGRANLETDLSDDHPISFVYDAALASQNGELSNPDGLDSAVRLDSDNMMQCVTCHDPHDDLFGQFLVMDNRGSALCLECHDKQFWMDSVHGNSPETWNGIAPDPWPNSDETTVSDNACGNCHTPHDAGSDERLLNYRSEEQNCFVCHNGNVAASNIEAEFSKVSVHPVASSIGIHDPTENPVDPGTRHVECVDCHNPHAAKAMEATAPAASGALAGVNGVDTSGAVVNPITDEYELCYKCHADSIDIPGSSPHIPFRQFPETNTRLEFDPTNESFHPIEAIGKNSNVPSLIAPFTESTMIYCTDCHNGDQSPSAGGGGPNGPHGSAYPPLLERNLRLTDFSDERSVEYALCYKCHNRNSILNDESFKAHKKHIVDEQTACTTCHDSHGTKNTTHLINFNLDYVTPFNGTIEFVDDGLFAGNCTLTCHGKDHDALEYQP